MDYQPHIPGVRKGGPLLSWDIFMDGYSNMLQLAEDRKALIKLAGEKKWKHSFNFREQLFTLRKTVLVTDANQQIIYASSGIFDMNGYRPEEVIGKKPSIFQGEYTSPHWRAQIRISVEKQQPFEATLINYTKKGEVYNCHIKGYPVFNALHQLVNFIAFEKKAA